MINFLFLKKTDEFIKNISKYNEKLVNDENNNS
jgi:hypothetical protein